MSASIGEYKGRPTLTLESAPGSKVRLTFGLAKARLIWDHLSSIEDFIATNTTTNEGDEE